MHARNLPPYQFSAAWPVPGREEAALPLPNAIITELRTRRRRIPAPFWLLVATLAIAVGLFTWLVF